VSLVSLLSDFGLKDPYVAELKAVIYSINPDARIVDVSHEVKKFDILMGAFVLASAAPYFPAKSVHVAVVDPGVGTSRRPIIVETARSLFVGPDNGVLMLAASKETIVHVYEITNPKYMLPVVSSTFHGRDIFAPAVAHLLLGVSPSSFGSLLDDYVFPNFAKPKIEDGLLAGEVVYIDDFGNVVSNISAQNLVEAGLAMCRSVDVVLGNKRMCLPLGSVYGNVSVSEPLVLVGGKGFIEVAVNQGSASKTYNVAVGDCFSVSAPRRH
jgi:S-adenosylmethionine hydrolase